MRRSLCRELIAPGKFSSGRKEALVGKILELRSSRAVVKSYIDGRAALGTTLTLFAFFFDPEGAELAADLRLALLVT